MKTLPLFAFSLAAATFSAGTQGPPPLRFSTRSGAMAVLTVAADDRCAGTGAPHVSAAGVWVDGRYDHELLLLPGSGREAYDTLLGPFTAGRHRVELRPSRFWKPAPCLGTGQAQVRVREEPLEVLRRAPVLELRADTVGEQTDVPLFEYVEDQTANGVRRLRYTVVFSNEDGGTQTRALLARWGRTTDIEQVYEAFVEDGKAVREEFQGPDHEIRPFTGRRRGDAPILLVATLNNMVTDRGRGIACVRPVPEVVDLARATRESTLDARPWAWDAMASELAAEGKVAAVAPPGDRWLRQAPDPREHVYLEARLTLDHAVAAAWVRDRNGQRHTSHYESQQLTIDRDGWVRTAVPLGPNAGPGVADIGWSCLPAPGQSGAGSCAIEATRAFVFGDGWISGPNLVVPVTLRLRVGEEVRLERALAR